MVAQFINVLHEAREVTHSLAEKDMYTAIMEATEEMGDIEDVQAYFVERLKLSWHPINKRVIVRCKNLAAALAKF